MAVSERGNKNSWETMSPEQKKAFMNSARGKAQLKAKGGQKRWSQEAVERKLKNSPKYKASVKASKKDDGHYDYKTPAPSKRPIVNGKLDLSNTVTEGFKWGRAGVSDIGKGARWVGRRVSDQTKKDLAPVKGGVSTALGAVGRTAKSGGRMAAKQTGSDAKKLTGAIARRLQA